MKIYVFRTYGLFFIAIITIILMGCDDSKKSMQGGTATAEYTNSSGWSCASGENCQDVYDVTFTGNSVVTFTISNVSSGSVSQIALYAPSTALGGTDLFTGDTTELRCTAGGSCDDYTAGESYIDYSIPSTGTCRFAVTRDWTDSCSSDGTYDLEITSDMYFTVQGQTVDDVDSLASGYSCPQ